FSVGGGGAVHLIKDGRLDMVNCLMNGNYTTGGEGGAILCKSVGQHCFNVTIADNVAPDHAGLYTDGASVDETVEWTNTIYWFNEASPSSIVPVADRNAYDAAGDAVLTYCDIQDEDPDDSSIPFNGSTNYNIDDDPLFVARGSVVDYRLASAS